MAIMSGSSITIYAQQPKTALELNNQLASITDSLYAKGQAWGNKFVSAMDTKDFSTLTPYRMQMQQYIDKKLADVRKIKDINGSENLRTVMIDFLNYEKTMIDKGFVPVEKLGATTTEDDIKKVMENLTNASKDEAEFLRKVSDAQDTYAKKNGFTIEAAKQ